jgi:hypothetical protein
MPNIEVEIARYAAQISLYALIVSVVAAVLSAGAVGLEFARWLNEGVRLRMTLMPGAIVVGNGRIDKKKIYLAIFVANRGNNATTITNMLLEERPSLFERLVLRKKSSHMLVPDPTLPGTAGRLPFLLEPGKTWSGMAAQDEELTRMIETGKLYVGISTSDRTKPIMKKIRLSKIPNKKSST